MYGQLSDDLRRNACSEHDDAYFYIICMFICIRICMCIYIYIFVCICICIYMCIHEYIYSLMLINYSPLICADTLPMCIYLQAPTHTHTNLYTYIHLCVHTHTHTRTRTQTHTGTDTDTDTLTLTRTYVIRATALAYASLCVWTVRCLVSAKCFSFAEYNPFRGALLQKRPIILRSLLRES